MSAEPTAVSQSQTMLRITYGLIPVLAGLDKFLNLLTDWSDYVSPLLASLVPLAPGTLMSLVGLIEIAAGLLILSRWTRLGAWVVSGWLVLIALNLIALGKFDIAVRDLAMAVGAVALARLSPE